MPNDQLYTIQHGGQTDVTLASRNYKKLEYPTPGMDEYADQHIRDLIGENNFALDLGNTDHNLLLNLTTGDFHSQYVLKSLYTTTGDILYASAASTPTRLGISSEGFVLKIVSGVPAWGASVTICYDYIVASDGTGTHLTLAGASGAFQAAIAAGGKKTILMCNDETISTAEAIGTTAASIDITIQALPYQQHTLTVSAASMFTFTDAAGGDLHFVDLVFGGSASGKHLFSETAGAGGAEMQVTFDNCNFLDSPSNISYIVSTTVAAGGCGNVTLRNCTGNIGGLALSTATTGTWGTVAVEHCTMTFEDNPVDLNTAGANYGLTFKMFGGIYTVALVGANWCNCSRAFSLDIQNCTIESTQGSGFNLFHLLTLSNMPDKAVFKNIIFLPTTRGVKFFGTAGNFLSALTAPIIFENIDGRVNSGTGSAVYMIDVPTTNAPPIVLGTISALRTSNWTGAYNPAGPVPTGGFYGDHGTLTGLSDDDHTIYPLLLGRAGGQTLIGGTAASEILILRSTSHATRGGIVTDGYARIGSDTAPTNVTAGDLTATRLVVPNAVIIHSAITQLGGPVVIPTGGVLRFSDADDSHYIGLRSPAVAQTENWVIHLPSDDPAAGESIKVTSVSSPDIFTEWAVVGHTIREDGSSLAARTGLNLLAGLIASDDSAGDETEVVLDYASTWALT